MFRTSAIENFSVEVVRYLLALRIGGSKELSTEGKSRNLDFIEITWRWVFSGLFWLLMLIAVEMASEKRMSRV